MPTPGTARGHNVWYEFVHNWMRSSDPTAARPARGLHGRTHRPRCVRSLVERVEPAYQDFRERVIMAERFGAERPWLDAYGAVTV